MRRWKPLLMVEKRTGERVQKRCACERFPWWRSRQPCRNRLDEISVRFRDSSMAKSSLGWIVDDHEPLTGLCIISHVGLLVVFCYLLHICHKGNTNPYGKRAALTLPPGIFFLRKNICSPSAPQRRPMGQGFGFTIWIPVAFAPTW